LLSQAAVVGDMQSLQQPMPVVVVRAVILQAQHL
jgi:hypothetical protein